MSDILSMYYQQETDNLCEFATLSKNSKGRKFDSPDDADEIRTPFMRDRDRIIHSKSFRRLMHKTQCFLSPEGDHYRTRLTHTLEVSQIARTIAKALMLNEDLTEAIALGHDLGHTPFGHAGERVLNELSPYGFSHNKQSYRIVDILERDGKGLNLTEEVKDGILCHTGDVDATTPEGRIIKFADRIAYINHDIDDAIRAGVLSNQDIPKTLRNVLGETHSNRIDVMVNSVISSTKDNFSVGKNEISMDAEVYGATMELRDFLFKNVYFNPVAKSEEVKACEMLRKLYQYFFENTDKIPPEYKKYIVNNDTVALGVCDYLAGMTDRFAVQTFRSIFVPVCWAII